MTTPCLVRPHCPRPVLRCACGLSTATCWCGLSHRTIDVPACGACTMTGGIPVPESTPQAKERKPDAVA